ncbi:hypothetical protein SUGI_0320870 [Cryptomeria japonica]|uniref:LOB domain-containing protein 11-like n=1 Tax=Cryptomeria japonica TaxID=3369 RepID=UPI002408CCBA|nr:LOB domain-containing protein 11-like [Cryptomeria japonica]XP_057820230.1 LOB domain-containing protein 11 [Cryptomeria japonica]GLJ18158.1 hypothetical protein SUGI_0320840 [Cryptomeria japonica]GLJ18160.1 hypothetical protein SUGI_0320870 [Cryptomeria japonica]
MSRTVSPCAACKVQRRKCGDKCLLAPYFPPNDPQKFFVVHKLFGASNIAKILRDIPAEKRADTVTSLVYEASVRVKDPIYGCTGAICRLQKQVLHLQSQLATTKAEILDVQANLASFVTATRMDVQANLASFVTVFCNSGETATRMDVVDQNDPFSNNEVIVSQYDEDPFGLWAPL